MVGEQRTCRAYLAYQVFDCKQALWCARCTAATADDGGQA